MFKNKQGFSDLIVMTIIGGILGSLFILGVFVWKEVELFKTVNYVTLNPTKISDSGKDLDNKEEDNGWLTYNNKEHGISFQYPSSWSLIEKEEEYHLVTVKSPDDSSAYEYYSDLIRIDFYPSVLDMPLNKSKFSTIDEMITGDNILTKEDNIDIDGISGKAFFEGGYVGGLHVIIERAYGFYDFYFSLPNKTVEQQDLINTIKLTNTFSKELTGCTNDQREAEVCAEIYQPVCANVVSPCIVAPCPVTPTTFSNSCEACKNSYVSNYREGQCYPDRVYIQDDKVYYYNGSHDFAQIIATSINEPGDPTRNIKYNKAILSPNGRFIIMRYAGFEWLVEQVYDTITGNIYRLDASSSKGGTWLDDNRIRIEGECGMGISCGIYESVNSSEPWILERIGDYTY